MRIDSYKRAQEARKALLNRGARYWADDGGREDAATAQHEGGHALVGLLLGLNPTETTIDPGPGYGGRTTFARTRTSETGFRAFDRIVFSMAGPEAEKMFSSADNDGGGKGDLAQARALAASISDDVEGTIKRARRCARKILKANFVPLTKIAIALLDRRTLDLAEVEELLATAPPEDDASDGGDDDAELLAPSIFDRDPILMRMLGPRVVHYGSTGEIL
jgi:ATP-dependent Zn protease